LVVTRLVAPVVGREVGPLLDGLLTVLGLRLVLGLGLREPELRRIRRVRPQVLVMPRLIAPVVGREVGSLLDGLLAVLGLRLVLGLGLSEPELRRIRRVRPQVLVMPRLIAAVIGRLVGSGIHRAGRSRLLNARSRPLILGLHESDGLVGRLVPLILRLDARLERLLLVQRDCLLFRVIEMFGEYRFVVFLTPPGIIRRADGRCCTGTGRAEQDEKNRPPPLAGGGRLRSG